MTIYTELYLLIFFFGQSNAYRCDAAQFGNIVPDTAYTTEILEELYPGGLALCARECLFRLRCSSFNYKDLSDQCQLNGGVQYSNSNTIEALGTLFSEKRTWPPKIAGNCQDHTCNLTEKCVPKSPTGFTCKQIYYYIGGTHNTSIYNGIFNILSSINSDDCALQCFLRSACRSFNFKQPNSCELSTEVILTDFENYPGNQLNSYYKPISEHHMTVAGSCQDHSCPENSICVIIGTTHECQINYCQMEDTFSNVIGLYNNDTSTYLFPLLTNLRYKCNPGYYPSTDWICQADGTWSNPTCTAINSCSELYTKCDSTHQDGQYILKFPGTEIDVKLSCQRNDSRNLIPVNETTTFSYFSQKTTPECQLLEHCGKSYYYKLRTYGTSNFFNILSTNTYGTHECSLKGPKPVYAGKRCSNECGVPGVDGQFQVDLRGTGFRFENQSSEIVNGSLEYSSNLQIVTATCSICNSTCYLLTNARKVYPAPDTVIDTTGATRPVCTERGPTSRR